MIEIRRILCPTDFSDFSKRALDHAVAIAHWYGSSITLLHVRPDAPLVTYSPAAVIPSPVLSPEAREALFTQMKHFAETEVGSSAPIELDVAEGDVARTILARAEVADLLLMGTHGRSGLEHLVLGSVTEKVLRKARCPVLTVPRAIPDAVPSSRVLFKRILCATDFSDCSMHALNYAMSMAQEADAHLTVLHVIEVPSEALLDAHETVRGGPTGLKEFVEAAEEERRIRLAQAIPEPVRAYCEVDTVTAVGKPYREILRVSQERDTDLIVIGIRGRGAADLLFFGSTAHHVVRQASCPVLTLRRV